MPCPSEFLWKLWKHANIKKKGRGSFQLLWDRQSTEKFSLFLLKDEYIGQYSVLVHIVQKDQHFECPRLRPILSVLSIKKTRNLVVSFQRNVFVQNLASEILFAICYLEKKRTLEWLPDFFTKSVLNLLYSKLLYREFLTWYSTVTLCNYTHAGQTFSWLEKGCTNSSKLKEKKNGEKSRLVEMITHCSRCDFFSYSCSG